MTETYKKGTVYKNLWAGYETYFILERVSPKNAIRSPWAYGYDLVFYKGKWNLCKGILGKESLRDSKHCPIVGHVDIDKILINGILKEIGKGEESDA